MEFRGLMGGLYRISEWIMRLSVINVLWVVCSIPFFYLMLAGLIATTQSPEYFKQALVLVAIVAPFTLFPATAAMFTVARKWVTGDEDVPLFKTYFRGYKENYLQSMLGGILFVLLTTVMYVNYTFYLRQSGTLSLLSILFIVLAFLLIAAMFHFFSIMVHFHMKFWQIMKNAFLITIGNPVMTVLLLVSNGVVAYISVYHFTFLIPFFMGSLMAYASFWNFYRIFDRMKTLSEKKQQEEEEREQAEAEEDGRTDDAVQGGSGSSVRTDDREGDAEDGRKS
ncbi:YesL family protein [Paenibacillus flagellatus]|uniref:DUF624 domain-containing protein n=1 Tax=Paenibacillus flagellatus TaxID=2211139 RepID=A0A2V5L170_9BACL|nr:DUF624 domain-containing protein [Paenibacillus flagellatus]PYI56436.1 hypothetical protein DLM86_05520 [Paenibacillus flagellatus]